MLKTFKKWSKQPCEQNDIHLKGELQTLNLEVFATDKDQNAQSTEHYTDFTGMENREQFGRKKKYSPAANFILYSSWFHNSYSSNSIYALKINWSKQ